MVQKKSVGKIWSLAAVLIMAALLLLSLEVAWNSGKSSAQSKVVLANTKGLQTALDYFYSDQNRFPTAIEFADRNTMIRYATLFPPPDFVSKSCSQSFVYKRASKSSYTLNFCLPKSEGGIKAGWSQTISSK